uniref:HTH psq-type domain-containing protein n=2 Tax=Rhizophagus irregularis TaxID=588596 RepID=U9TRL6_RHIID
MDFILILLGEIFIQKNLERFGILYSIIIKGEYRKYAKHLIMKNMVRGNFHKLRANVTTKRRRQWSAREKLMVITYYERGHSKRSTADKFNIEPKQLREWISNKERLLKAVPYIQKLTTGARPKYPQLAL